MGKGENAGYQHFLFFPQCFQKAFYTRLLKDMIVWKRVKKKWCLIIKYTTYGFKKKWEHIASFIFISARLNKHKCFVHSRGISFKFFLQESFKCHHNRACSPIFLISVVFLFLGYVIWYIMIGTQHFSPFPTYISFLIKKLNWLSQIWIGRCFELEESICGCS